MEILMSKEISGRLIGEGLFLRPSQREVPANNAVVVGRYDTEIDRRSYPWYLEQHLFNATHEDTIRLRKIAGGKVNTLHQLEPWEWGAVMVTGIADKITLKAGRVPAQFVYHYPEAVQTEYHTHLLAGLHTSTRVKLPGEEEPLDGRPAVIAMENAVSQMSGERLSGRSIATQHVVLVKTGFSADSIDPSRLLFAEQVKLSQETLQKMPSERADAALQEIENNIKKLLGEDGAALEFFKRREDIPYGYTIVTPIKPLSTDNPDRNALEHNARLLSKIMQANFFANLEISPKYIQAALDDDKNNRFHDLWEEYGLEGYTNRHYYYFAQHPDTKEESLHVTISSTPLGGAAYENAGRVIIRRPGFKQPFTEDEVANFRNFYAKEFTILVPHPDTNE